MDAPPLGQLDALYREGDYQGHIRLLQEHRKGLDGAVFHYNMGTAYLKMEETALGRYHLEKAKALGVLDIRVQKNLAVARSRLSSVSDIDNSPHFVDKSVGQLVGLDFQYYLLASLCLLLGLLLIWRRWMGRSLLLLPLLGLLASGAFVPYALLKNYDAAVVMEAVALREGPNEAFEEVGPALAPGAKVVLGREDGPWRLVAYPESLSGWIKEEHFKTL